MLFYDFECFRHDWLVVIMDTDTKETHVIVNDRPRLIQLYEENKNFYRYKNIYIRTKWYTHNKNIHIGEIKQYKKKKEKERERLIPLFFFIPI